ncbi:hypothetical protein SAMN05192553_10755 [Cyclobacterium xiamenense]|uniref:Methane oxygenase PmoA n=1 Tax=Cyclobacterium xiamenense TaxID=1297121 RepID=A0A1H7AK74_9BACT|nr:hypothetical protein [Cyclobacterium xiamenense]SEJ64984.1 hypothetical protein SAMN05192553_10755 [Cyclobacterium xiamenense]
MQSARIALLLPLLALLSFPVFSGIERVSFRGWSNCYRMYNETVDLIIHAETGGRVLAYRIGGKNILYADSLQDGKRFEEWQAERFDPDGGRLDYGPEALTQKLHAATWMGPWQARIEGPYRLVLSSMRDEELGLRSERILTLSPQGGQLKIFQRAENISQDTLVRHFWSRTLVQPGGILTLPVDPENSRFAAGYGRFEWGPNRINPEPGPDERIWVRGKVLHFHAVGSTIKAGSDALVGWMGYQWENLLFIKHYPVFPEASYAGSEHMMGIFYSNGRFAEMEPCSPSYRMAPGDRIEFTEYWELIAL